METNVQGRSLRASPPQVNGGESQEETQKEDLSKLRSLDRFLGKLLDESWREISENLGGNRGRLEFSGILPLGDAGLLPFMDQPGVFLLLGPAPSLTVLTLGSSQAPMSGAISAKVSYLAQGLGCGRDGTVNDSTPMYAACISMEEEWNLVRPYWALLNRRI